MCSVEILISLKCDISVKKNILGRFKKSHLKGEETDYLLQLVKNYKKNDPSSKLGEKQLKWLFLPIPPPISQKLYVLGNSDS